VNLLKDNWTYAKINDLISNEGIFVDGDWIESKDQNPKGKVRLIQLADIGDGIFRDKSNRYLTKEKSVELRCTYLKKQDILVARLPEPLGRACIFPLNNSQKYITAVDICIIRPANKYVNIKYLLFLINSPTIRIEIDKLKSGTTRKRISSKNLAKIDFPVAPMNEQNRIVVKIEELFSDLDKATEDLKKSQEQLKIYRQAVLKAAFEGKLTEEWRLKNPYKQDYTVFLYKKIEEANQLKTKGDLPRRLPPIKLKDLYILPNGWQWVEAHKVCQSVRDGTHDTPKYVEKGIPLITSKNLKIGEIDFKNVGYISEEDHKKIEERSGVRSGDILFGMIGTIGNPVIVKDEKKFSIKNVGLFKQNPKLIFSKYLKWWLESNVLFNILKEKDLIRGTTQKFISLGGLRVLPVPIPAVEEQEIIIQEIESRLPVCDKLKETVQQNLEKIEYLQQSILKKAFEGKLVPQDPKDEPAEKFLERIKQEKEKFESNNKKRKKR